MRVRSLFKPIRRVSIPFCSALGHVLTTTCIPDGSYASRSGSGRASASSPAGKGMKSYNTPKPKRVFSRASVPRTVPSTRPYGFEESGMLGHLYDLYGDTQLYF